jgi:hypothetical protein
LTLPAESVPNIASRCFLFELHGNCRHGVAAGGELKCEPPGLHPSDDIKVELQQQSWQVTSPPTRLE